MEPQLEVHVPTPRPHLQRIGSRLYEVGTDFRPDMLVPARVFADEVLAEQMARDRSLDQLVNVSTLRGIVRAAYGMPDMHEGYGFPVGGVAATLLPDGVVSPGGIGFDINCGVRLLTSAIEYAAVVDRIEAVVHELSRSVPAGFGRASKELAFDRAQLDHLLNEGVPYLVTELSIGLPEDLERMESGGRLPWARSEQVTERAKNRGHDQLGTLGGGNHFLEVQVVDEVYDRAAAKALGIEEGRVTLLIHTGSRGLGHQVCTDWLKVMDVVMPHYGIEVPDRQLACVPFSSREGQGYFAAMAAAANFGFGNRHVIAHRARQVFTRILGPRAELHLVYDVAHNTAKVEEHDEGQVCVHRKGATRAFGPSSPEIPKAYRAVGQPVFIPGSMGTASHVLVGTDAAAALSFGSCCHGAGRALSRTASKRQVHGATLRKELEARGIVVRCASNAELAEEAPLAYKDVDRVVDVVHDAGIARKVARLVPVGVVKG